MKTSREVALESFSGAALKHVIYLRGVDLTGEDLTFAIALQPGGDPVLTPATTLLDVTEDSDLIPTSIVQAYSSKPAVGSALGSITGIVPGEDAHLFYEFRVSSLPGEVGTPAVTTLLHGDYIFRGSVDV